LRQLTEDALINEDARQQRDANFKQFFNNISETVFVVGLDKRIIYINEYGLTTLGYTCRELIEKPFFCCFDPTDKELLDEVFESTIDFKSNLVDKVGAIVPVDCRVSVSEWSGQPVLLFIARDISERINYERALEMRTLELEAYTQELKATEEELKMHIEELSIYANKYHLLQTLLDTLPIPVFYKDLGGKYVDCNNAFVEYYGAPKSFIVDKSTDELFPEFVDEFKLHDQTVLDSLTPQVFYHDLIDKDGNLIKSIIIKTVFTSPSGKIDGIFGVVVRRD
jgi:PAS domain S-box-containing protein